MGFEISDSIERGGASCCLYGLWAWDYL